MSFEFDPSTARPVSEFDPSTAVPLGEFDHSTAVPVDAPKKSDEANKEEPTRTWGEAAGDLAVDVARAPITLSQTLSGLGNLATGGLVGKGLDAIGYQPKEAQEMLSDMYSDSRKKQQKDVASASEEMEKEIKNAEGFGDTTMAALHGAGGVVGSMIKNPGVIQEQFIQTLPDMLFGSGVIGKIGKTIATGAAEGLGVGSTRVAELLSGSPPVTAAEKSVIEAGSKAIELASNKLTYIGHGIEGAQAAGQNAWQIREDDPTNMAGQYMQIPAGILTGLIGGAASKVPGFGDVQTAAQMAIAGPKGMSKALNATGNLATKIGKGMVSEGLLQELPQSAQEQIWQNLAQGKPWSEGVATQGVQGALVGGLMGAGEGGITHITSPHKELKNTLEEQKEKGGILSGAALASMNANEQTRITELTDAVNSGQATPEQQADYMAMLQAQREEQRQQILQKANDGSTDAAQPGNAATPASQGNATDTEAVSPDNASRPIVGEPINSNWTAFHPDSGTLNVPRVEMPQIKSEHRDAMVNYLESKGIDSKPQLATFNDLKPTQAEFSPAKVEKAKSFGEDQRPVLVSSDGHVLDGHHQWLSKQGSETPFNVLRINAPIKTLLKTMQGFDGEGMTKEAEPVSQPLGATNGTQATQAEQAKEERPQAPAAPVESKAVTPPSVPVQPASKDNKGNEKIRARRAQIQHMVSNGFDELEHVGQEIRLANKKTNEHVILAGGSRGTDVTLAAKAVAELKKTQQNTADENTSTSQIATPTETAGAGAADSVSTGVPANLQGSNESKTSGRGDSVQSGHGDGLRERLGRTGSASADAQRDRAFLEEDRRKLGDTQGKIALATPEQSASVSLPVNLMAGLIGDRSVIINNPDRKASDGYAFLSNGHTYINATGAQIQPSRTAVHEPFHQLQRIIDAIPEVADTYSEIWDLVPDSVRQMYFEGYLSQGQDYAKTKSAAESGDNQSQRSMKLLKDEMMADFMAGNFHDKAWLEGLAKKKPYLFQQFIKEWIPMLDKMVSIVTDFIRKQEIENGRLSRVRLKDIDALMEIKGQRENLIKMKDMAMDVATFWAEKYPGLAQKSGISEIVHSGRVDMEHADLQAELDAELGQSPSNVAAHGVMAENAYPEQVWTEHSGGLLRTIIPNLYHAGQNAVIQLEPEANNLWSANMRGTWIGPANTEQTGDTTLDAAKAFVKRFIASKDLRDRGFDLATTISPKAKADLIRQWNEINKADHVRRYAVSDKGLPLKAVAAQMGLLRDYEVATKVIHQPDDSRTAVVEINSRTGDTSKQEAVMDIEKVGGQWFGKINTSTLNRGGAGAAVYQLFAAYADSNKIQIQPDDSLSGVNTYRRTEQMLSSAFRTGKSNVMTPHKTQRLYGFNNNASTPSQHNDNLARMLLAGLRNVRELAPDVDSLVYHPETDKFTNRIGESRESQVNQMLTDVDARAFGLGRSTIARAVLTRMMLDGEKIKANSFQNPVLYSAREQAEQEFETIKSKYQGTDQWLKAPNGEATALNEHQWVQVRTPSFRSWFGDWEKFAGQTGGVWNDGNKEVSKAVDKNGEPLVIYHGTDDGGFYTFHEPTGKQRGDLGNFATDNVDMAKTYTRRGRSGDLSPPTSKADLERRGYDFFVEPDGSFGYAGHTNLEGGFATQEEAVQSAIDGYEINGVSGVYAVFANIRNPHEEDFQGAMWSGERTDQYHVLIDGEVQADVNGDTVFDHDAAMALAHTFDKPDEDSQAWDNVIPAFAHFNTTDGVVKEARKYHHDGAIIRNVIDAGGGESSYMDEPSDVFVTFKPNQLKSADWNSGEFGESEDIRYSIKDKPTSDIGHKRNSSGRYIGSPDWVGSSPEKLKILRRKLEQFTKEGESRRYWYEKSSRSILDMVGGDKDLAEKFVGLLAIYSQGTSVSANTTAAIKAWMQWRAGIPITAGRFPTAMGKKATEWLNQGKDWGGIKTNNFYLDLMEMIDPGKELNHSTMDMWMALAFDYRSKTLDQGPKYFFAQREIKRIADKIGWKPHQVQAAIWSSIKGRVENSEGVRKAFERSNGILVTKDGKEEIAKGREYDHFRLAHKLGYEHDVTQDEIHTSGFDFSDALASRMSQMSMEAIPGTSTGILPGIHDAPLSQKMEYTIAMMKAFKAKGGGNIIDEEIGHLQTSEVKGFSGWEGSTNFGVQRGFVTSTSMSEGGIVIGQARDMLDLSSAIHGLLLTQDGVAWHLPIFTGNKSALNGVEFKLGRLLTYAESDALYKALSEELGHTESMPIPTEDGLGFRVMHFPSEKFELMRDFSAEKDLPNAKQSDIKKALQKELNRKNDEFFKSVAKTVHGQSWFEEIPENGQRRFESDGNLVTNDWSKNDSEYRQAISAAIHGFNKNSWAGRPNIFEWIDQDLRPIASRVNQEFAQKYGWDQQTRLSPREQDGGVSRSSSQRNSDHGEEVRSAIHYGKQAGLSVLSGSLNGTGIKGAEQSRLQDATDPRIKKRVYFYLPVDGGIPQPELGLGGNVYKADLSGLYNPLTSNKRMPSDPNAFESALLDSGFNGYIAPELGVAVMLNRDVPVEHIGSIGDHKVVQRKNERVIQKTVTRTEGQELVRKPETSELMSIVKNKADIIKAAPSFRMEYGEARVHNDDALAADRVLQAAGSTFQFSNTLLSKRDSASLVAEQQTQDEAKPERKWAGLKVAIPVKIEDTGEVATLIMDVNNTLDDYEEREANIQRLLECL